MKKQEWIDHIQSILNQGRYFNISYQESSKASLLFAVDVFRRRMHHVTVDLKPTPDGKGALLITISPEQNSLAFTVKRDQSAEEILQRMSDPNITSVSIRGCGTVIDIVCLVVEKAINSGWYVENTHMNTLTQQHSLITKQRNTTMLFVMRRGSQLDTI